MLYIASDHAGYKLKQELIEIFKTFSLDAKDLGPFIENPDDDYPDFAYELSKIVVKESAKGILICRSGIGMSIAANKVKGIYAALCETNEEAIKSREHNNSNVLVLNDNDKDANQIFNDLVKPWLDTEFASDEERHVRRIEKIKAIEEMTMK
ncbi:MAG: RpiB/LacA/LacB family sugar-phosphate isomerase [bacterium]